MAQFSVHDAKTNLSRLIARALEGEDVVIARGNVPVVRLFLWGEAAARHLRADLVAAQAQAEGLTLVSREALFDTFSVARLW